MIAVTTLAVQGDASLTIVRTDTSVLADTLTLDLTRLDVRRVLVNGVARASRRDSIHLRVPRRTSDRTACTERAVYDGTPKDGLIIREGTLRGWSAFGNH